MNIGRARTPIPQDKIICFPEIRQRELNVKRYLIGSHDLGDRYNTLGQPDRHKDLD
jgi:hypothetical protein